MRISIKNFKMLFTFLVASATILLTSCNKEGVDITDIESFSDGAIENLQGKAIGKSACLEFVFPVSIQFSDESTSEVDSYDALHETIVAWFTDNEVEKTKGNRPELLFPIQVLNQEGEIVDVESKEALKELKNECPKSGKCKGKKGKGFKCFSLVYPLTITIDGVDSTFEDKESMKTAIKSYKETAGDEAERPTLVYPVTVQYDDETQVEVASQEDLQALKEACQTEG